MRSTRTFAVVILGLTLIKIHSPAQQPPPLVLSNVWSVTNGDVVPLSGFAGTISNSLVSDVAKFRYTGADGYLEYQRQRPSSPSYPLFGSLMLNARMTGGSVVNLSLAPAANLTWTQSATVLSNAWEVVSDGIVLNRWYHVGSATTLVQIKGQMIGKSLVMSVTCDRAVVSHFDGGLWGGSQQQLYVPYYSSTVRYVPSQNLFVNAFLDWTASSASSESGTVASYGALTSGSRNLLQERMIFTAAWHLNEVFPNLPAPPSPWRETLADKMILEIWDGPFTNMTRGINDLAEYGITNCVVIVHDWQRSGYDNALPSHYPAGDYWGGDSEMTNLAATVTGYGMRFALHENYADYYPNYDFWDPDHDVSLNSDGSFVLAWYNSYWGIQSYGVNPNSMVALASLQSPLIHSRYKTGGSFLDVHSAVAPWFHVNHRASDAGAGTARRVWEAHQELWDYERTTHKGPVFGEGGNHWFWTGYLDGVEAQFEAGWPKNQGPGAPLYVDFDLLKMHPLQFNHGMGYYDRWWPVDFFPWDIYLPPMIVLDQYRMQQMIFGHAAFRTGYGWESVPAGWLEHNLVIPVTARYATARAVEILYQFGGAWTNASTLAKWGAFPRRVRVEYENGLKITANSDEAALQTGTWELPEFGWIAEGAGVTAGTTLRNGIVTDFADTGERVFVNARPATDWYFGATYSGSHADMFYEHLNENNTVIDFGEVRTDGSALLWREGNQWVLKTWPREKTFTVELNAQRFGQPPQVTCIGSTNSATTAAPLANGWWRLALNGASEYRWSEASLESSAVQSDGSFHCKLHGLLQQDYTLWASSNLTDWVAISTNQILTNPLSLTDPNATDFRQRFYRVERDQ